MSPPSDLQSWHEHRSLRRLVDQFGSFFQAFGFKRNLGRIWATLYLSPRPLDQAELSQILGLSAGLISTSLRELEGFGAVRVTTAQGSRRALYEAERRLLRTVATILTRRDLEAVLALREVVVQARTALPQGSTKAWVHERLALVEDVTRLYEVLARLVVRVSHGPEARMGSIIRALRNTRAWLPGLGGASPS
jgi:DNA-binding transcriptional regulator GbsR (MarR family)